MGVSITRARQTRKKKKRKIRNLQADYEEKETEKRKEECTFEICSANGKDSQNGHQSRVGVVAQMNREKEGESSETKMIEEMGK